MPRLAGGGVGISPTTGNIAEEREKSSGPTGFLLNTLSVEMDGRRVDILRAYGAARSGR